MGSWWSTQRRLWQSSVGGGSKAVEFAGAAALSLMARGRWKS